MEIVESISYKEIKNKKRKKRKKEQFEPKNNQIIFQDNKLIEAKYNISLQEKRLLVIAISKTQTTNGKIDKVTVSCDEVIEHCGLSKDPGSLYVELKKLASKIRSRTLIVRKLENPGGFLCTGWVNEIEYYEKKGLIEIQFSNCIVNLITHIKDNFTIIPIAQTLGLSSIYAMRLFELLKQYEKIGERKISVSELRSYFSLSENKLKSYKDFKRDTILIAQREINSKTDIRFDFYEIKQSKKVVEIVFEIHQNKKENEEIEKNKTILNKLKEELKDRSLVKLNNLGFSRPTIKKFFDEYDEIRISKALSVVHDQVLKGQALNPKALFRSALKGDWSLDKYTKR